MEHRANNHGNAFRPSPPPSTPFLAVSLIPRKNTQRENARKRVDLERINQNVRGRRYCLIFIPDAYFSISREFNKRGGVSAYFAVKWRCIRVQRVRYKNAPHFINLGSLISSNSRRNDEMFRLSSVSCPFLLSIFLTLSPFVVDKGSSKAHLSRIVRPAWRSIVLKSTREMPVTFYDRFRHFTIRYSRNYYI